MTFRPGRGKLMQGIIDAVPNPIFVKDRSHRMVVVNDSACAFFGHSRETLLNAPHSELFPEKQTRGFHEVDDAVFATGDESVEEEQVTDGSGTIRHVLTRKRVTRIGRDDYIVASLTDMTITREVQEKNNYLLFHDTLTGLPNRALLKRRIEASLKSRGHGCALVCIAVDRFNEVNDSYGHAASDELIREFAARLSGIVRSTDTVARLGGNDFAILLADTNRDPNADQVSRRALKAAARTFEVAGARIQVGATIGVVLTGTEDIDATELQRRGDVALLQAKTEGRGCFRVFTDALNDSVAHRQNLQADLREALATGVGLEMHYQPIIGVSSGKVEVYEALIRWRHSVRGLVMPGDFIPAAEASGQIIEIDEWVLTRACADAAGWDPALRLSVNVSAVQFAIGDLVGMVGRALRGSDLDPRRLELEVTEGVLIQDPAVALKVFSALRKLGVQIVLDDFGIGYSSLSYLRDFPFDKIKIDRSFVSEMIESARARSIVQAVISLAHGLDIKVVAEGVESHKQLAALTKMGCTQAQGYLLGRPAPLPHPECLTTSIDRQAVNAL